MPRTSEPCPYCDEALNIGTHGLFLDSAGQSVGDWREATWKTCPGCSVAAGTHVFLRFPDAFGSDAATRALNGEEVPENNCVFHRQYRDGRPLHAGERNPDADQWECSAAGVARSGGSATPARAMRHPQAPPRARARGLDDAPWSEDAASGAVRFQGGMVFDPEGERRLVAHFQIERDPEVRRRFLAAREGEGRLACDACGVDLGAKYGRIFAKVVEVHHLVPIAAGVRRTALDDLALLCPTCHRVVHYRTVEPRSVEEVARIVGRPRT
jgi:hypothetical protein